MRVYNETSHDGDFRQDPDGWVTVSVTLKCHYSKCPKNTVEMESEDQERADYLAAKKQYKNIITYCNKICENKARKEQKWQKIQ